MRRLLCWFGVHRWWWVHDETDRPVQRYCLYCEKDEPPHG